MQIDRKVYDRRAEYKVYECDRCAIVLTIKVQSHEVFGAKVSKCPMSFPDINIDNRCNGNLKLHD